MIYIVSLTNFETTIYEGSNKELAMAKAVSSGFECTFVEISEEKISVSSWTPIAGWRLCTIQ